MTAATPAASTTPIANTETPSKGLHIALWVAQVLLAVGFAMAGLTKLTQPIAELAPKMGWVTTTPEIMVRLIGLSEVLGSIGLIAPAALRIQPKLTGAAAWALALVMVLATGLHVMRGELGVVPVNVVLGGLAAFVGWGRLIKAPIAGR